MVSGFISREPADARESFYAEGFTGWAGLSGEQTPESRIITLD